MERLTKRESANVGGREFVLCNYKKEDCNDSCMYETNCKWQHKAFRKLKEYEDAEEQGLLLRLPCKVGDTVYSVISFNNCNKGKCTDETRKFCYGCENLKREYFVREVNFQISMIETIGETVFLTREQAEKKANEQKEL